MTILGVFSIIMATIIIIYEISFLKKQIEWHGIKVADIGTFFTFLIVAFLFVVISICCFSFYNNI